MKFHDFVGENISSCGHRACGLHLHDPVHRRVLEICTQCDGTGKVPIEHLLSPGERDILLSLLKAARERIDVCFAGEQPESDTIEACLTILRARFFEIEQKVRGL